MDQGVWLCKATAQSWKPATETICMQNQVYRINIYLYTCERRMSLDHWQSKRGENRCSYAINSQVFSALYRRIETTAGFWWGDSMSLLTERLMNYNSNWHIDLIFWCCGTLRSCRASSEPSSADGFHVAHWVARLVTAPRVYFATGWRWGFCPIWKCCDDSVYHNSRSRGNRSWAARLRSEGWYQP